MNESANLPINFGGIEEKFSSFTNSRVLILPVAYQGTDNTGMDESAMAIVDASRQMELYEDETNAEVYKIGIHTLDVHESRDTPEEMMRSLYECTKKILESNKFLCLLGGEHSISAPVIKAHAEKFHNLSVLQIDAHANLHDEYGGTKHSHASIMARVVKDMRIPAVQVGIRSISADETRSLDEGLPTKIFWAKDIWNSSEWIDEVVDSLTDNVYLTIDISGLDPSIAPFTRTPEPGGLGWYQTITLIRKLAEKKRVVGMDLVEFTKVETENNAPIFLCAKLVYKSLAYIFFDETPKIHSQFQ
jgi:agmatinase